MSPYKKFLAAVKEYFESVPALKFLLSMYIVVFAVGGLFFVLGSFIWAISDYFICIGTVLMLAGLLLTIIQDDMMTLAITSAAIALISLIASILAFAGVTYYALYGYGFGVSWFSALFYFLAFGAIAVIVFLKSEKFRDMRAAASKPAGIPCPRCGGIIPFNASFCPQCAAPNPGPAQYAPPAAPQYAPPAAPQPEPVQAEPAPAAPAVNACVNCGAELPVGAMFCGKCGTKQ